MYIEHQPKIYQTEGNRTSNTVNKIQCLSYILFDLHYLCEMAYVTWLLGVVPSVSVACKNMHLGLTKVYYCCPYF